MITYEVPKNLGDKKYVTIVYKNQDGKIFTKSVNIPRNEDGSIDEEYFNQILDSQLKGVENKWKVGSIEFSDPGKPVDQDSVPETVKNT